MASSESNPFDHITWINPTGKTVNECAHDEQADEKQLIANKKAVAAQPWRLMYMCVTLICVTAFILVNAAWLLSINYPLSCTTSSSSNDLSEEHSSLDSNKDIEIKRTETQFVYKREWAAFPNRRLTVQRWLPVPYVIVSETSTPNCFSIAECSFQVKFLQQLHIHWKRSGDIVYNFLIGGDGRIYVGRGWNWVGGYAPPDYYYRSITVSFIGVYDKTPPLKAQLDALQALMKIGVQTGKLKLDYKLLAYQQIKNDNSTTPNPGRALYDAITMLPHWLPNPSTSNTSMHRET